MELIKYLTLKFKLKLKGEKKVRTSTSWQSESFP